MTSGSKALIELKSIGGVLNAKGAMERYSRIRENVFKTNSAYGNVMTESEVEKFVLDCASLTHKSNKAIAGLVQEKFDEVLSST